jgi:hypothetical protein
MYHVTLSSGIRRSITLGGLLLAQLLGWVGCASVNHSDAQSFSMAVTAARAQTKTAFDAVSALTRENAINFIAKQSELRENDFVTVPNAAAMSAWSEVTGTVETYAKHLAELTSGAPRQEIEDSLQQLAKQFNTTADSLKSKAGIDGVQAVSANSAGGFTAIAGALVQAHAAKEAKEIATAVDPHLRKILLALADLLGSDLNAPGLRLTVRANWDQLISEKKEAFKKETPEKRGPIIIAFVDMLAKRDVQDEQLVALRRTLLSLADAHTALAQGKSQNLASALDFIVAELKHARDLQDQFTKAFKS